MKQIFTFLASVVLTATTYAQVGIGTTNPNTSAALDITSTTKGFLPPRMTTTERNAIGTPATGLVIFNTTTNGLEIKSSTGWTSLTTDNVTITEDNTSSVALYPVFVSNNVDSLALKVDTTTTPLSYIPSTGDFLSQSFTAAIPNGTVFSRLSSTQLQVADVPSKIVTITSNQISVGPNFSDTKITPTTVTATTFVTDTAPAAGNQLGNKTYIDNFGGSGGWYYTATQTITAGTSFNFANSLSNTYNAYEIYFVCNLTAPTSGFPTLTMTFNGIGVPVYSTWNNQTSSVSGGSPTQVNTYLAGAPIIQNSMDYSNVLNRQNTFKVDLWGTRNISGGSSGSRLTFLQEGFLSSNPGFTGWIKNFGTIGYSNGTATGITLTSSVAFTGSITIIVKAKY